MNLTVTDAIKYIVFLVGVGAAVGMMQGQVARLTMDVQDLRTEMRVVSSKLDRYIQMQSDQPTSDSRDTGLGSGSSTARRSGR